MNVNQVDLRVMEMERLKKDPNLGIKLKRWVCFQKMDGILSPFFNFVPLGSSLVLQ